MECSLAPVDMKTPKRGRDDAVVETSKNLPSPKRLVIGHLKRCGMLRREQDSSTHGSELQYPNDFVRSLPCEICRDVETSLELLICDNCGEAFHLSCCDMQEDDIPDGKWHCATCPKLPPPDDIPDRKKPAEKKDPRIGNAFQAEVACWSGQSPIDHDYFGAEMDLSTVSTLEGWYYRRSTSVGNWVQCRGLHEDKNGKKIVCGKWRRAPLMEKQTDEFDCSCAVAWDPIHADCAVPQELDTSEVRKQLRFVKMINKRLAAGTLRKFTDPYAAERLQIEEDARLAERLQMEEDAGVAERLQIEEDAHAATGMLQKDEDLNHPKSGDPSGEGHN